MLTGDALAKTLAKSQNNFLEQKKIVLDVFFFANCWRCSKLLSL